jgi:glutamate decarboxylase
LQDAVGDCQRAGKKIIAVIGLAGSTECGSIDPLSSVAAIARSIGAHFHVDAAWGAPLALSPVHRHKVAGIELSDSVTVDAHKQFYAPVGSSFLLLRDPHAAKVIEQDARYLFHRGAEDLGKRSLEGSRPGSSLFLHAALHVLGRDKLSELVARNHENARFMAELIRKSEEFELLCDPDTNIVVYRFIPAQWRALEKRRAPSHADESAINKINADLQRAQSEAGRSMVSRTTLFPDSARLASRRSSQTRGPVVALRAVLGNPLTSHEDLRFVLEDQLKVAAEMGSSGR